MARALRIPHRWLALGLACAGLALLVSVSSGCLGYLARAGCGQLEILRKRRPVAEVLRQGDLPARDRERLLLVQEVQHFAGSALALTPGKSFTLYSDIGRPAAAWNVSAAPELALRAHTWWFPIVGTVPYLGFFSPEEAQAKAEELRAEGFDTVVRPVAGYSTLGWFDDPLLSSQLRLSPFYLARLVIHESVHATLWFPGDVRFNESLASFVERRGALEFYRQKYGPGHPRYLRQVESLAEGDRLRLVFRETARRLERAYKQGSAEEKRRAKAVVLGELQQSLRRHADQYRHYNLRKLAARRYNNAHLLSYLRYDSGGQFFESEFRKVDGDWRKFMARMKTLIRLTKTERQRMLSR